LPGGSASNGPKIMLTRIGKSGLVIAIKLNAWNCRKFFYVVSIVEVGVVRALSILICIMMFMSRNGKMTSEIWAGFALMDFQINRCCSISVEMILCMISSFSDSQ
jgi:hypothetical protein